MHVIVFPVPVNEVLIVSRIAEDRKRHIEFRMAFNCVFTTIDMVTQLVSVKFWLMVNRAFLLKIQIRETKRIFGRGATRRCTNRAPHIRI